MRLMNKLPLSLLLLGGVAACGDAGSETPSSGDPIDPGSLAAAASSPLIDVARLDQLRAERGDALVILDLTNGTAEDDQATYKAGHIPGAIFVNWRRELAEYPFPILTDGSAGALVLPQRQNFQESLRSAGIDDDSTIVVYDNFRNRSAIRALFVLEYYGKVDDVFILEGGLDAYSAACTSNDCLDTCTGNGDCPQAPAVGTITLAEGNANMTIGFFGDDASEGVRDLVANPRDGTTIIDARPYEMYVGDRIGGCIHTGEPVYRRGHMPGALARPWPDNESSAGYFKEQSELLGLYSDIENYGAQELVLYCNEGLHAVYDWFVLTRLLGYPKDRIKVYEGSIGEYSRQEFFPGVYASSPQVSGCGLGTGAGHQCRASEAYPPPALTETPPAWYTGP